MPTFQYKIFEFVAGLIGVSKAIPKGLDKGAPPSDAPPRKVASRWVKTRFRDRDIWTCAPKANPTGRAYVHQHGGAYVLGLNGLQFSMMTELSDTTGAVIILPDYPLPPERFAEDIIDWAAAHFDAVVTEYGSENIMLGGDSAGANLALALCQTIPDIATDRLILISPWVDLDMANMDADTPNSELLLDPVSLRRAGHRYAGNRKPADPLISPINANLTKMPPMTIITGEMDLLHSDIAQFAALAKAAGVRRKYAVYGEYGHYWMFYPTPDRCDVMMVLADALKYT